MASFVSSICVPVLVLAACVLSPNAQLADDAISNGLADQDSVNSQLLGQLASISDQLRTLDQRLSNIEQHVADQEEQIPFRITRVEKSETVDFYRVKVKYEGSPRPSAIVVGQNDTVLHRLRQLQEPREVREVEFDVPKDPDHDHTFISFYLPGRVVTARLALDDTPHSMDIPLQLHFQVMQGQHVIFQPGQQVQLDVAFDVDGDIDSLHYEVLTTEVLVPWISQDNTISRHRSIDAKVSSAPVPVTLDQIVSEGPKGHRYGRFLLNSTIDGVEGMVDIFFGVELLCHTNCLVRELWDMLSVEFYQEDHEAPFPKDSISFIQDDWSQDTGRFYCNVDSDHCQLSCEALGEGLTDIEITGVTSQPRNQLTSDVNVVNGNRAISWLQVPDVRLEDSWDFLCTARSETGEASKRLTLVVVQKARILTELSNVTELDNGTLLFTCIAEGIPTPTITFDDVPVYRGNNVIPDPHVTHPSQSQTRADIFLTDYETRLNLYGMFCDATTVPGRSFLEEFRDTQFLSEDSDLVLSRVDVSGLRFRR